MYDSLKTAYNRMGIKGVIRHLLQEAIGMQHYEENIDTLLYFFNHYADIRSFPKATGSLRKLQEGDTLLLRIVDKVCRKHHLTYWLDAGTLLGAVRHEGFIPWDDDMDIAMIRSDYERALPILKEELGKYGIQAEETKEDTIGRIGITYHHKETGLNIDLFPFEFSSVDPANPEEIRYYDNRCSKYKKVWMRKKGKISREEMFSVRKKYLPEICNENQAKSILDCPDWYARPTVYPKEDVFPVTRLPFEGYEFSVPHQAQHYLETAYGPQYMSFPKSGMAHHGDDRGKLSTWAEETGTDMDEINSRLESILNDL